MDALCVADLPSFFDLKYLPTAYFHGGRVLWVSEQFDLHLSVS